MKQEDREQIVIDVLNILRAVSKGLWKDEDKIIEELIITYRPNANLVQRVIQLFNNERIALEHSELSERLESLRVKVEKGFLVDQHCPEFSSVEIECADLVIRCLDFCGRRNLRIGEALITKMKYNKNREFKHEKNF